MSDRANGRAGTVPPHDPEAEAAVLGSVLQDPLAITRIPWLRATEFYDSANGIVLQAAQNLFVRSEPIDTVQVAGELVMLNALEKVGGRARLEELIRSTPSPAAVENYAKRVRDRASKRRAIEAGYSIIASGYDPSKDARETAGEAQRAVLGLAEHSHDSAPVAVGELASRFMSELGEGRNLVKSLPTGFRDLDEMVGGLRPGDLVYLAGRPGMGKSALGVQIGLNVARSGGTVVVFSLEMAKEQLTQRLLSVESRVNYSRLDEGQLSELEIRKLSKVMGPFHNYPLYLDEQRNVDDLTITAKARNMAMKVDLKLVILDYIQLVKSSVAYRDNRVQQVGHVSQALKALAGDIRAPVLAMAQLSRAGLGRPDQRPQLHDLRESGSLEQDADQVWGLWRDDYNKRDERSLDGKAELIVLKHRNGRTGSIALGFDKDQARFYDWNEPLSRRQSDDDYERMAI